MSSLPRAATLLLLLPCAVPADWLPVRDFFEPLQPLQIVQLAQPLRPFTVSGEYGAVLGRQTGKFEAWLWPNKIFSNLSIRAELADYPVPIDLNSFASQIAVTPAETVITYAHPAFTVREHIFVARGPDRPALGGAVVFQIDATRPVSLLFSFTPEMLHMWPAPNFGRPNGEWVKPGLYLLHTDDTRFTGIVGMPRTKPGIMVPYQEHPQTFPLELKLDFDPKQDHDLVFPLVFGLSDGRAPGEQAAAMISDLEKLYRATRAYYESFFTHHLSIETPDHRLDQALAWAEASIDQSQVRYGDETGMVAGYYESADSARPGYGWFFGRDTLWSTYAINSYGDAGLTRRALDFIIKRQRQDGKIMHEFSQSAAALDWRATPYFYAAADSSPLFIMAMLDYVRTTGDIAYLKSNWEAVKKASAFSRAHESTDGITNNSQGTGWVESWPPGMPYQEIYLAALDCQAQMALSRMAAMMSDSQLSKGAEAKAAEIRSKIPAEYFNKTDDFYAFSIDKNADRDDTPSIYPAVAWWDNTLELPDAGSMLSRWASAEFSTDWGTRDISNRSRFYDPISYHQGTVWPLFTGWVSLAEYRAKRPLAGYASFWSNAQLTWASDLGAVTELLSGDFYQPLGRSSSHQTWSSAMVVSPLLRGLFGLDWDVSSRILRVHPQLPASWPGATLRRVPFGSGSVDLTMTRQNGQMVVEARGSETLCLEDSGAIHQPCQPSVSTRTLHLPLPPVEVELPAQVPQPGARTTLTKILDETYNDRKVSFVVAAQGGSTLRFPVRVNRPKPRIEGGVLMGDVLIVKLPSGEGYVRQPVSFNW